MEYFCVNKIKVINQSLHTIWYENLMISTKNFKIRKQKANQQLSFVSVVLIGSISDFFFQNATLPDANRYACIWVSKLVGNMFLSFVGYSAPLNILPIVSQHKHMVTMNSLSMLLRYRIPKIVSDSYIVLYRDKCSSAT